MGRDQEAIEQAWQIHAALMDWTGKVDAKATFALTLELAAVATVVTLRASPHRLSNIVGIVNNFAFFTGFGCMLLSILLAMWVVTPRLRSRKIKAEAFENFIYFGHLKDWKAKDLAKVLSTEQLLSTLSTQLINTSRICWKKHLALQWSLRTVLLSAVLIAFSAR